MALKLIFFGAALGALFAWQALRWWRRRAFRLLCKAIARDLRVAVADVRRVARESGHPDA